VNQPIPSRVGVAPGAEGAAMPFATAAIARGLLIAFPTETFYGLGADPAREDAVAAIFAAKGRGAGEALPLIAAGTDAARGLASRWSETAGRLAAAFWPGPLTLVVPVRAGAVAPGVTAGRDTVAVRVPGHPLARILAACAPAGVLTATSANRSGFPALTTADEVQRALGKGVTLIVDGGPSPGGLASTIVDVTGEHPRLIREGPVAFDRVLEFVR
jgi:L-threonylcarbamoyladenylate synthase